MTVFEILDIYLTFDQWFSSGQNEVWMGMVISTGRAVDWIDGSDSNYNRWTYSNEPNEVLIEFTY